MNNKLKYWRRRYPVATFLPLQVYRAIKPVLRPVIKILHKNVAAHYQKHLDISLRKFAKFSAQKQQQVLTDLQTYSLPASPAIKVTLIGASRRKNNPNNRMDNFFKSLLQHTADLNAIEVLVRIDNDDDLLYFHEIWKTFGKQVRIRFVLNETVRGYENLFKLVSELLDYLADSSKVVFGFADDCLITRQNWDVEFDKICSIYPDNIFFINTLRDFTISYANKDMFFWLLWQHGPPSLFSAVGRRVLEITKSIALKYPGWTAYGNSVMCDSFFEALQLYIWELTGKKRAPVVLNTIYAQTDIAISPHKEGGLFSASPVAIRSNKKFLENETQKIIAEMAANIASLIKDTDEPVIDEIFPSPLSREKITISFVSTFENFLQHKTAIKELITSLNKHTLKLEQVEFVVGVKEAVNFANENIQALSACAQGIPVSYFGHHEDALSLVDANMLKAIAPSSRIVVSLERPFTVNSVGWDEDFIHIANKYSDNMFMIDAADNPILQYEDEHKYFWELWHNGYTSSPPVVSRHMLELIAQSLSYYPDEKINNHIFFHALGFYIWKLCNEKRMENLSSNFVSSAHFSQSTYIAYEEYKRFLTARHQAFIKEIASKIVDKITRLPSALNQTETASV